MVYFAAQATNLNDDLGTFIAGEHCNI